MICCVCGSPLEAGEPVDFVDGDEAHVGCALEYDDLDYDDASE